MFNLSFNNFSSSGNFVLHLLFCNSCDGRKATADNLELLNELLTDDAWSEMYDAKDTDGKYNSFLESFTRHLDFACPIKQTQISCLTKLDWITSGIKKSSQTFADLKFLSNHQDAQF